jgi:outer membrane protein assembly factor BamA
LSFDTINNSRLNAVIDLVPSKTQSFGISVDGTNSEGVYGTEGSVSYTHNNLFHGGEKFMFSIKGGLETQLLYSDTIKNTNAFNTLELGPEFRFIIPKYFLINNFKKLKSHTNSKTEITGAVNYQQRPDFKRWNQELSFGWVFHEKNAITWHINPIVVSAVDIDLDPLYELQIKSLNDQFIATSFLDHIIAGGLFSFEYNGQDLNIRKQDFYAKATFESAGGALFRFHELNGKQKSGLTNTYYDLFNIRYSHFQKFSLDLRYYQPIFYKSKLVYRVFAGLGIPKANQRTALPFEKSFFSGGSNGMRAWKVRSLGPGSFADSSQRFDKIGDVKFEGNIETRFPISEWIEGALFLDMGNVWLLRYDSLRSAGHFKWNSFVDQIAFGGGFGIRLNLDFFIIRADIAIPLKNPAIPFRDINNLSSSWIFDDKFSDRKYYHPVQFNLGIGYPF